MAKRNEDVKFFITKLMEEEQDEHSKLVKGLCDKIGLTDEYEATLGVLKQIHSAKMELLEYIYKEL